MRAHWSHRFVLRHGGVGGARILLRILTTAALVGAFLTLVGTSSQAYTQSNRAEQKRYAEETVNMTYTDFLKRKADFQASTCRREGYLYQGYPTPGCRKPSPYNAFDWTDDGCSGREQIKALSLAYRNLFNKPCQLHDFGYRNFGAGLTLDRTEQRRALIDNRFLSEMRRLCNGTYAANLRVLAACHANAVAVWTVVHVASDWRTPGAWFAPVDAPSRPPVRAPLAAVYTVMNTSETLPDGVWFRSSPHTADTRRITGLGVYRNDQVRVRCYAVGDAVGAYANGIWYLVDNLSRPTAPTGANSGYVNTHYVSDGMTANHAVPGIPAC